MEEKKKFDPNKYIKIVESQKALRDCPRCGHKEFTIHQGYNLISLQDDYSTVRLGGGNAIPTVIIMCRRCGFLSQHASLVLDKLDNNGTK